METFSKEAFEFGVAKIIGGNKRTGVGVMSDLMA